EAKPRAVLGGPQPGFTRRLCLSCALMRATRTRSRAPAAHAPEGQLGATHAPELSASVWTPVLWATLLVALGLRAWHLGEGLPEFFEEAFPFRRAFDMAGWNGGPLDWNPHAFHYPSLSFYLHLVAQWAHYGMGFVLGVFKRPADYFVAFQVDPSPMALVARSLGV